MPLQHLSGEGLRETIQQAREISEHSRQLSLPASALEAYLQAGEEMKIPREALLQTLRKREPALVEQFHVGDQLFAPSMDGFWYTAERTSSPSTTCAWRASNNPESSGPTALPCARWSFAGR